MTDAPENIWLPQCHAEDAANQPDGHGEFIGYTRADIADAREAEQVQWVKDLADTVIAHETRIAELEVDKVDLMRVANELLARIGDVMAPPNGELNMHSYGQTPAWFVEAAFLGTYGTLKDKI